MCSNGTNLTLILQDAHIEPISAIFSCVIEIILVNSNMTFMVYNLCKLQNLRNNKFSSLTPEKLDIGGHGRDHRLYSNFDQQL